MEALFSIDSRAFGALAVGSEVPSGRWVTSSGGYAPLGLGPTRRQPVAGLATRDPVELEVPLGRAGAVAPHSFQTQARAAGRIRAISIRLLAAGCCC